MGLDSDFVGLSSFRSMIDIFSLLNQPKSMLIDFPGTFFAVVESCSTVESGHAVVEHKRENWSRDWGYDR